MKEKKKKNWKGNVIKEVKKNNYPDTHATPKRRTPKSTDMKKNEVDKWRKKNNKPSAKSVWLKNSKKTREVIFSTPEILMEEFENYVQFCKDNPWLKTEYKTTKSGLRKVEIPTAKPVTVGGFMVFCGVGETYWKNFRAEVAPRNPDFGQVIDYIYKTTREQNIEGATVHAYNGNIISRLHSLVERTDITSGGEAIKQPEIKVYNTAPPLASNEDEIEVRLAKKK